MEKREFSISLSGKRNDEIIILYRKDVIINDITNLVEAYKFKNDLSTFIMSKAKFYYKKASYGNCKYMPYEVIFSYNGRNVHHTLSNIQLFNNKDPFLEYLSDKIEKFLFEVFDEKPTTQEELSIKNEIFIVKGNIYSYNSKEKEYFLISECYGDPTIEEFSNMLIRVHNQSPFGKDYDQLKISLLFNKGFIKNITIENIAVLEEKDYPEIYLNNIFIEKDIFSLENHSLIIKLKKEPKVRKPRTKKAIEEN